MANTTSEKQLAQRLKGVPLFSHTSARHRKTLAKLGKVLTWKQGSVPITEGSKGAAFFLLLEGGVEISRGGAVIARVGSGEFVGEMALLRNAPRNATVSALAETMVFALGRKALHAAIKTDPSMALPPLEAMAARQQSLQ
jgi:CRP-like cAMP-binding protein